MIKTIVLDLDDTLYPEHQYVLSGFSAVGRYLKQRYSISNFSDKAQQLFLNGVRGTIFNDVLDEIEYEYTDEFIKILLDVYRTHSPAITLFDDAKNLLERYVEYYQLALITDGYSIAQWNKLSALNIKDYFQQIIVTDDLGRDNWKPSPLSYQLIEERLGCISSECVYIGDNSSKDFYAPNKLGWCTIRIQREGGEYSGMDITDDYEARYIVRSLDEVDAIIQY